jgi:hypothetical protein
MFNSFLNIYLRIFYSSFPLKKVIIMIITGLLQASKHHADIKGNCTLHAEIVLMGN